MTGGGIYGKIDKTVGGCDMCRKFCAILLAICLAAAFISCGGTVQTVQSDDSAISDSSEALGTDNKGTEAVSPTDTEDTLGRVLIDGMDISEYTIVLPFSMGANDYVIANMINEWYSGITGEELPIKLDYMASSGKEIIIGNADRGESAYYFERVYTEYFVLERTAEDNIVMICDGSDFSAELLEERLKQVLTARSLEVANNNFVIASGIRQLRDPAVFVENGVYYMYGTGWSCVKNTSGRLDGDWIGVPNSVQVPADATTQFWAPEVHKYKGAYYMFTTYYSSTTGKRGCTIMKADSPEGPFVEITNGHVTPKNADAIDGTLYIDKQGQPWLVYVAEWTGTNDKVGRMAAAKLSDDLTHLISTPIELFRADSPSWHNSQVTDGCYMYRCSTGELLMIWSSHDRYGYCVGIARSSNGEITGRWTHDEKRLFSQSMTGQYDGGHGMLFTALDGRLYMALHSPNTADAGRSEAPIFVRLREENGTLVWDR